MPWALLGRWLLAKLSFVAGWLALVLAFTAYVTIVYLLAGLVGVVLWVGITLTIGLVLAPMIGSHYARVECPYCYQVLRPNGKHRARDVHRCPVQWGVS